MARKTVLVSDLSGSEIANERDAVTITVTFADARRGQYTLDAHADDPEIKSLIAKGRQQTRRGRRPKQDQPGRPKESQRVATWTKLSGPL
jgi:hypothetical protein